MSLFARLWNVIRRPTSYVGKDLQGNYFYEYSSASGGRSRRVVKYRGQTDTLAVAERSRQLAVQWKAWLTHTRQHPPTLEELQADMLRQARLQQNVALIEARDREERLRLAEGTQAALSEPENDSSKKDSVRHGGTNTARVQPTGHQPPPDRKKYDHDPWVPPPSSDEPQSWTPRAMRRGE